MNAPASLSLSFEGELLDSLRAAAAWRDTSLEQYIRSALERASRMDAEFAAFVQVGLDDIDAGRVHTQEEVEAWFEDRYRDIAAE